MKTLEQLKELTSKCLDGRDFNRLAKFVPYSMIKDFGMEPNEEYDNEEKWNSTVVEFTRENILKQGFNECFRVLDDYGVLVFKWNEDQVTVKEVLRAIDRQPLFGHTTGRSGKTMWMCFMKLPNN